MINPLRIALATYRLLPNLPDDDAALVADLSRDHQTTVCLWDDPNVDWQTFDAVLIRSIWDYFERYPEYLAWLDRLQAAAVPCINPIAVLRWNSDKRYLAQLASADIAIVPTRWMAAGALGAALAVLHGEWVVKPAVSGGAWLALRGNADAPEFLAAVRALPSAMDFMLQPFLPEITQAGEWSLLYFGGVFSHAVRKTPTPGDYRIQPQHGGQSHPEAPPAHVLASADRIMATTSKLLATELVYARVDGVVVEGEFLLMELELIEPFLYFDQQADAATRMAQAVRRAVRHGR